MIVSKRGFVCGLEAFSRPAKRGRPTSVASFKLKGTPSEFAAGLHDWNDAPNLPDLREGDDVIAFGQLNPSQKFIIYAIFVKRTRSILNRDYVTPLLIGGSMFSAAIFFLIRVSLNNKFYHMKFWSLFALLMFTAVFGCQITMAGCRHATATYLARKIKNM